MRAVVSSLIFALSTLAAGAHAAPQYSPYSGSGYGQPDQVFRCESTDGRARRCAVDTRGGVRLVRQVSGSSCIQGRSWGYDRDGVWVTDGCRADFATGYGSAGSYGNGAYAGDAGYYGGGQAFRCESSDGRWRTCAADTRGGMEIVRQLSDASCIRGQTWGWDDRGVWVNNGCRAEFRSGGGSDGNAGYGAGGSGQVVRCESMDGRYRECAANVRGGVRLARQLSGSACIEGRTWGASRAGLWVDDGCRGEFELGYRGNNGWAWGNQPYDPYGDSAGYGNVGARTVRCESTDGRTRRCGVAVQGVRLQRQVSDSACLQGQTWGWDHGGIWVSGGCRGDFAVW